MISYRGDHIELDLAEVDEVDVRVVGGEVNVTGTAAPAGGPVRVEVDVHQGPDSSLSLRDGRLVIDHQPVRSLADLLGGSRGIAAIVTLAVPEDTLVRIRGVSAAIFVGGIRAGTSITTVSGRVTATGLDGDVDLKTVSGEVEVQGVGGTVRVNAVSGDATISGGAPEEITARSVSGDLTFDLGSVPDADCTSVSGDVTLRLPADAGVDLEVVSVSGRLETTFPADRLDAGRRRLRGPIGGGGRRVAVRTTSGDVTVLRRSEAGAVPGRT